ncbi:hypothetical protein BGZ80_006315 [Entomortierella chlamydospora]|uniref:Uncharacterized protein n=1 Tax=Entomortierella chlamydospora TaxID=101097 RepID=A0A9P6MYX0_9FUNG|nr:hypothetical protein BGZ80_006315 [Entomortierella chlamydospora]
MINRAEVKLIDLPGLYEPRNNADTKKNAGILQEALSRGYEYKLYFVLKGDSRGPDDAELAMMSRVSQCVKEVDGAHVTFRVIVNLIPTRDVYEMYKSKLANDNFKSFFSQLEKSPESHQFRFDIIIDRVQLISCCESAIANRTLKDQIAQDVETHKQTLLSVGELKASNEDLRILKKVLLALSAPILLAGEIATGVLNGTSWFIGQIARVTSVSRQGTKAFREEFFDKK